MSRTTYISIPSGLEDLYYGSVQSNSRFILPRIGRKVTAFSRRQRKGMSQKSLLPQVAAAWNALSDQQRSDWATAAAVCGMKGWNLFVKDKCYRIINEIPGNATPSTLHQALVGKLYIEAPADELKIIQPHPSSYYILQKVTGKKAMYEPVAVNEPLVLPITISLSFKSDLVSQGGGSFARFYAIIRELYQGRNIDHEHIINLPLSAGWNTQSSAFYGTYGRYTSYALYFWLYNVRGSLLVDNIKATHSSQNWARDTKCDDINAVFSKTFYQVPKHWAAITLPAGASYESTYPPD